MKMVLRGIFLGMSLQLGVGVADCQELAEESVTQRPPFASQAAVGVIQDLCVKADHDSVAVNIAANALGLASSSHAANLGWALAPDAIAWDVPSLDGHVLAYAYGADKSRCGVLIDFAITGGVKDAVVSELKASGGDFEIAQESQMAKGASFTRLHSATSGQYVDVIEYPGRTGVTSVVKVEFLPG